MWFFQTMTGRWLISGGLLAGWYAWSPFFLPSRYPVESQSGTTFMPSMTQWTTWLVGNDRTSREFHAWLAAAHPGLMHTYAAMAVLAAAGPFLPGVVRKISDSAAKSRREAEERKRTATSSRPARASSSTATAEPENHTEGATEEKSEKELPKPPPIMELRVANGVPVPNVFGPDALLERWANSTDAERETPAFTAIIKSRTKNHYAMPPVDPKEIEKLKESFPNFVDVLDFIAGYCAVGKISETGIMALQPLLLVGPPGVGKTELIYSLAEMLGVPAEVVGLGGNSGGAMVLGGMNSGWKGSSPGRVASVLAKGIANPLFLLDELDKVPTSNTNVSNLTDYLLGALEKTSARKMMDEFLGPTVLFDATRVMWVASANEATKIPEPLLTRFQIFNVDNIPPEKMPPVIRSIAKKLLKELGVASSIDVDMTNGAIDRLAVMTPREIKRIVKNVVLAAVRESGKNGMTKTTVLIDAESVDKQVNHPAVNGGA